MATFIYQPGVQVYIETTDANGKTQILDVTEDLVSGTVTRRTNAVSTMSIQIQNGGRKYDYPYPVFKPMDKIIVNMKRLKWVRVFTGYLTQTPVFSVWPQTISLSASCTLKRLQYWFWDPGLAASTNLINEAFQSARLGGADAGTKAVVESMLTKVVGWPQQSIHIAAVPPKWFDFMYQVAQELVADSAQAQALADSGQASVGSSATVAGNNFAAGTNSPVQGTKILQGRALPYYSGKCSGFGGPGDPSTRGHYMMFDDTVTADKMNVAPYWYYCALRVEGTSAAALQKDNYTFWKDTKILVTNPKNGSQCVVRLADWGPAAWTGRTIDLDPNALNALGAVTDDYLTFEFCADQNTPVGPVKVGAAAGTTSSTKAGSATSVDFLNTALTFVEQHKVPYVYGAPEQLDKDVPTSFDCSSFVQWVYVHTTGASQPAGIAGQIPRRVCDQATWAITTNGARRLSASDGLNTPGAVMVRSTNGQPSGGHHTEISCGNGSETVGAHHTGTVASREVNPQWDFAYLMPGISYQAGSGSSGPTGVSSSTTSTSTVDSSTGQVTSGDGVIATDAVGSDAIDQLFAGAQWTPILATDGEAQSTTGARALQNDEPILPYINNLMNACMRSYCSAPNGDLMAWFPDYFGVWGTAAKMTIEDVEVKDFTVMWNDEQMVTHQFVSAAMTTSLDTASGSISIDTPTSYLLTGFASIEIPSLMTALFGIKPTAADAQKFIKDTLTRFGARPDWATIPGIYGVKSEFFMAVYLFMQRWAGQFAANVPLTFMPELWPGMIMQMPQHNFQAYIQEVTHTFQFGENGSFATSVRISAPARMSNDNSVLFGLPAVPRYDPGTRYDANQEWLKHPPKGTPSSLILAEQRGG